MPMFKDALYLRRLYEKHYGQVQPQLISKYWVPQWSGDNPDSSARIALKDDFNAAGEQEKLDKYNQQRQQGASSSSGAPQASASTGRDASFTPVGGAQEDKASQTISISGQPHTLT